MSLGLRSKRKEKNTEKRACWGGESGHWELGIGGRGLLSALRDGVWKILVCCELSIFDSRLLPFPLSLSSPPMPPPPHSGLAGCVGGR